MPPQSAYTARSSRKTKSEQRTRELDRFGFIVSTPESSSTRSSTVLTRKQLEQEKRRVRKWSSMVDSWASVSIRRRRLVRNRLRKGLPDAMRGNVWILLGGVRQRIEVEHKGLYNRIVGSLKGEDTMPEEGPVSQKDAKSFLQVQETIERDIHRTYPRHSLFHEDEFDDDDDEMSDELAAPLSKKDLSELMHVVESIDEGDIETTDQAEKREQKLMLEGKGGQAALRRVLRAYSYYDREVGYCQGMNFIAAMFLTLMTEEEAFWLLVAVMKDEPCMMRGLFGEGMKETHKVLHIADKLIIQFLPRLSKHFEKENIHITMYATQWLLTQYTSSFHFDLVTRVWDIFLGEGWKITYRVMLALLQKHQAILLKMQFEEILAFFRELPDRVDGDTIVNAAIKIPLKSRHIARYEKEWKAANQ